jgi:hypothetical protein
LRRLENIDGNIPRDQFGRCRPADASRLATLAVQNRFYEILADVVLEKDLKKNVL